MKNIAGLALALILALPVFAQAQESDLFDILRQKDSELFKQGFDECDLSVSEKLLSKDLEFYHDKGGIDKGIDTFLKTMREGLCREGSNKIRRHLIEKSLKVFPMFDNGELYGAIQMGQHGFAPEGQQLEGKPARFVHLWLLENGQWKIARVLSYDHH